MYLDKCITNGGRRLPCWDIIAHLRADRSFRSGFKLRRALFICASILRTAFRIAAFGSLAIPVLSSTAQGDRSLCMFACIAYGPLGPEFRHPVHPSSPSTAQDQSPCIIALRTDAWGLSFDIPSTACDVLYAAGYCVRSLSSYRPPAMSYTPPGIVFESYHPVDRLRCAICRRVLCSIQSCRPLERPVALQSCIAHWCRLRPVFRRRIDFLVAWHTCPAYRSHPS